MEAVNYLLRCRLSSKEASFPIELIELIDHLQEHFGEREIEVISGYRSPALNASLRRQGRRVASKSYHMQGMAMDIRIPGVSSRLVRDYTLSLARGGVGYYGQKGFVHVDVGPVRQW